MNIFYTKSKYTFYILYEEKNNDKKHFFFLLLNTYYCKFKIVSLLFNFIGFKCII